MDSMPLIILGLVLVVAVILLAGISGMHRKKSGLNVAHYRAEWQKIEGYKNAGGAAMQLSVMEADKLLDQALKAKNVRGKTMGERLKSARGMFANNNAVWDAHKLRNRLAHESGTGLNRIVAERALHAFKAGLKDLGAL